jgi:cytochrome c-type protein NapB
MPAMLVVMLTALTACGAASQRAAGAAGQSPEPRAVTERDLGLRDSTLADDREPPVFAFPDEGPGGNPLLPRSFDGAPPLVPHSLDDLVPITAEENLCLLCYATGSTAPDDPPQVPRSHLVDWRASPEVVRDSVASARWTCRACQVVQSDAPALVVNTFGSRGR